MSLLNRYYILVETFRIRPFQVTWCIVNGCFRFNLPWRNREPLRRPSLATANRDAFGGRRLAPLRPAPHPAKGKAASRAGPSCHPSAHLSCTVGESKFPLLLMVAENVVLNFFFECRYWKTIESCEKRSEYKPFLV